MKERADGNCMYRAVARQLLGRPGRHPELRQRCCRQLTSRRARRRYAGAVLGGNVYAHVRRIRAGAGGGHVELQALADSYHALFQVWQHEGVPGEDEAFILRNVIQPVRNAPPNRVVRLLYNDRPGSTNGDHFDTLLMQCRLCAGNASMLGQLGTTRAAADPVLRQAVMTGGQAVVRPAASAVVSADCVRTHSSRTVKGSPGSGQVSARGGCVGPAPSPDGMEIRASAASGGHVSRRAGGHGPAPSPDSMECCCASAAGGDQVSAGASGQRSASTQAGVGVSAGAAGSGHVSARGGGRGSEPPPDGMEARASATSTGRGSRRGRGNGSAASPDSMESRACAAGVGQFSAGGGGQRFASSLAGMEVCTSSADEGQASVRGGGRGSATSPDCMEAQASAASNGQTSGRGRGQGLDSTPASMEVRANAGDGGQISTGGGGQHLTSSPASMDVRVSAAGSGHILVRGRGRLSGAVSTPTGGDESTTALRRHRTTVGEALAPCNPTVGDGEAAVPMGGNKSVPALRGQRSTADMAGVVPAPMGSAAPASAPMASGASCHHHGRTGIVVTERADGHCMYRAVARQLLDNPGRHQEMRRRCCRQLTSRRARRRYAGFLLSGETLKARVRSIRAGAWGGNVELKALADAHGVLVQVWQRVDSPRRAGTFVLRNLIQPARKAPPKRIVRLLYNEAPGATDGDHFDTVWLRCRQCPSNRCDAASAPTGGNGSASAPGDVRAQANGPGVAVLTGRAVQAAPSGRQGGVGTAAVAAGSGSRLPRQFAEALAMVGLEPHQWRQVGPSEFATDNKGGLHAAAHAFLESDDQDVRRVKDLLSAADPSSAKRWLRRLVAAKPLQCLGSSRVGGSARQEQQRRASALNATSVAAACPWPYLGSLRRAAADFNADHWHTLHMELCATCTENPGSVRLVDGTVVRVSPDCAWHDMALRLFCGFDLPVGHLAERWRQRLATLEAPAEVAMATWCDVAAQIPSRHPDNYASARRWSKAMDAKWSKELAAGWLRKTTGDQVHTTVPVLGHVRFGEQQRAAAEGRPVKVRFCSDLSHGEPSINGVTPPWPFRYLTMRDVLSKLGRGWYCAVADVDSCFRRFAWNDEVHRYMGLRWRGALCVDQRLCFGWSGAPAAVSAVTSAVCEVVGWAAQQELHQRPQSFFVHAYLDDVICGAATQTDCEALYALVQREFAAHGLALKPCKSQPPSTSFTYLGWYCDTEAATLTLTHEKRQELLSRVHACLARGVTRKTLESFAGALSHFVTAIPGGRSRMQSLWAELASRRSDPRAVRAVGSSTRGDLLWFQQALQSSVATQLWHDYSQSVVIVCDASGLDGDEAGFGAVCIGPDEVSVWQRQWSAAERKMFESSSTSSSSTLREMLAAYLAAKHYRRKWADAARPVLFITDSSASAFCILRGATRAGAASGARPALDQLCRDMSDMFVAAGSDFAAWWCSRDTPCLKAVDWLSRTNAGTPRAQAHTIWTPGEFAVKPAHASIADAADGGKGAVHGGLVRQVIGRGCVQLAAADGDCGVVGQAPRALGVQCDVGSSLRRRGGDAERARDAAEGDSRGPYAIGCPSPRMVARDALECRSEGEADDKGVVRGRVAVAHTASPGMACVSA